MQTMILDKEDKISASIKANSDELTMRDNDERFQQGLQTLAHQARLMVGAHLCSISYIPNGDYQKTIHEYSLSDKYEKYKSYDVKPTGKGIVNLVIEKKAPIRMTQDELVSHNRWKNFSRLKSNRGLEHPPLRGWLAVPILRQSGEFMGVLQLSDKYDGDFTLEDEDLLYRLANVAFHLFELQYVNHELQDRTEQLKKEIYERCLVEKELSHYEHIASNSTDMLALLDNNFNYLAVNSAYSKAFEMKSEHFVGHSITEVFGKNFFETVIKPKAESCLKGENINYQHWLDFPAYGLRFMDVNYYPYIDANNKVKGFVVNARDVTENKRTEEALQNSKERLQAILDNASAVIYIVDDRNRIVFVNNQWEKLFHKTKVEVIGKNITDVFPKEIAKHFIRINQRVFQSQKPVEIEEITPHEDGLHTYISQKFPLPNTSGDSSLLCGISTDITARKHTEEALRENEEKYRLLVNNTETGFVAVDDNGCVIEANAPYLKLIGAEKLEDILGRSVIEWTAPESKEENAMAVEQCVKKGFVRDFETTYIRQDGTRRNVLINATTQQTSEGKRLNAMCRDITIRKVAEEALERQLLLTKTITDNAASCLFMMNRFGHPTYMNPIAEEVTGFTLEEIRDKPLHYAVHHHHHDGQPYPMEECPIDNSQAALTVMKDYEDIFIRKDGSTFPVVCSLVPLEQAGEVYGSVLEFRDVTEQKRVEVELLQSEQELTIRNKIANIFLTHQDDKMFDEVLNVILSALESEFGVFGYIDENTDLVVPTMTRHIWDICQVPDKNIVFHRETWGNSSWPRAIREMKTIYSNEPSAEMPQGHVPIKRHISLPIIDQDKVIGLFQVANKTADYNERDIQLLETIANAVAPVLNARLQRARQEIKRETAEKEQKRLNKVLEAANKELQQIVYTVSHDLRSPLVNIQGFNKEMEYALNEIHTIVKNGDALLKENEELSKKLERDVPEAMHYINKNIEKMDTLLYGLLQFSRTGSTQISIKKLNMNRLISDVLKTHEFQISKSGAMVVLDKLPGCKGDESQINQIFSNMLDNSLKYLDPNRNGMIHIGGMKKKNKSIYCFEDNGIGIAEEHHAKIFGIFHQLNPESAPGEGLGLSIVQRILERHDGKIWLESKLGSGSKFFVALPS